MNAAQLHERVSNALAAAGYIIAEHQPEKERPRALLACLGECASAAVWLERLADRLARELEVAIDADPCFGDTFCSCRACRDARAHARLTDWTPGSVSYSPPNGESSDEHRRRIV